MCDKITGLCRIIYRVMPTLEMKIQAVISVRDVFLLPSASIDSDIENPDPENSAKSRCRKLIPDPENRKSNSDVDN